MYLIIYRQLYVCFIGYLSDVVNFINSTGNLLKQVGWVFKVLEYILVAPCSNSTIIYSLSYLMNINSAPYSHLQNSHMVFFHLTEILVVTRADYLLLVHQELWHLSKFISFFFWQVCSEHFKQPISEGGRTESVGSWLLWGEFLAHEGHLKQKKQPLWLRKLTRRKCQRNLREAQETNKQNA